MSLGSFYFKIKVILLFVLMPLSTSFGLVDIMAMLCAALDGCFIFSQANRKGLKMYISALITAVVFLLWNILLFVWFDFSGVSRLVQFACVVLGYYSTCCLEKRHIDFKFACNVIFLQLILFLLWWPVTGFITNYYSAFYGHGNFLGGILIGYLAVLILTQRNIERKSNIRFYFMYAMIAFLLLIANSRSVFVTVAVFLFGLWYLNTGKENRAVRRGIVLIAGAVFVAVSFTIIYPQLLGTKIGTTLNLLSKTLFDKWFFSGRQIIWKNLETYIAQSPLIGYGLDKIPSMFFDTAYSGHSLWLQTALQSGLIGVGILLLFYLNAIRLTVSSNYKDWRIAVSFGAAFILHECLEVTLTQNNFSIGIIVWFILGLVTAMKKNQLAEN